MQRLRSTRILHPLRCKCALPIACSALSSLIFIVLFLRHCVTVSRWISLCFSVPTLQKWRKAMFTHLTKLLRRLMSSCLQSAVVGSCTFGSPDFIYLYELCGLFSVSYDARTFGPLLIPERLSHPELTHSWRQQTSQSTAHPCQLPP